MIKLLVYIVTMNKEKHLYKFFALDSWNTDRTEEITYGYGTGVIFHNFESIGNQIGKTSQNDKSVKEQKIQIRG